MKFTLEVQVPGVLSYEFSKLTIEGTTDAMGGGDYQPAITAANGWAQEQRSKLPPHVLEALDPSKPKFQAFPQKGAPAASAPRSAPPAFPASRPPSTAQAAPQGGQDVPYGPLGYPAAEYAQLMGRLCKSVARNGRPVAGDSMAQKSVERDFVRAAAWNKNEKTGREYFTIKNTMAEFAADMIGRNPSWGAQAVARAWEKLANMEKALLADGRLTLQVSLWSNGAVSYAPVEYTVQGQAAAAPAQDDDFFGEGAPNDDSVPF